MDVESEIESWVDEMLLYVSTVRPELSHEDRKRQRQTLLNFRIREFQNFNKRLLGTWQRGLLFEALARSDPSYPQMSNIEHQITYYLIGALRFDLFGLIDFESAHSHPDDIIVKIDGERVVILAVIEVKLNPLHRDITSQLTKMPSTLGNIAHMVNLHLKGGLQLPKTPSGTGWPDAVRSLVLPEEYERILYVPDGTVREFPDWLLIKSSFTHKEVFVIADFLTHIGKTPNQRV